MKQGSMTSLAVLMLATVALVGASVEDMGENEKRLVYDLFKKDGYNPLVRPVVEVNHSLQINFSLALSQIISIDEKNQVMKTNVWLQIYWHDYQLSWEPSDYGEIKSIRIKPESVWVPDIVLFNNADGNYEVSYKSNCVIYNNGEVNWIPPAIYKSSCSIDVRYFPFDEQVCEMKFGSWTFRGSALTYAFKDNMDKLDLNDYLKSGTWDIIDCPGKIETMPDEFGESKQIIVFTFKVRRKTLFYTVNLIIPCVLISFVSVCVFALPADAGEKITLCISVLLALVVFLLLISKILPPSLTIPLIAKYLLFCFVMNIVAILATVIIINRNYRTPRTHRMPYWVRVVFLNHLPRYLFMKRPDHEQRWQPKPFTPPPSYNATPVESRRVNIPLRSSNDLMELTEFHHQHCKLNTSASTTASGTGGGGGPPPPPPPPHPAAKTNCHDTAGLHQGPESSSPLPGGAGSGAGSGTATMQAYRRTLGKSRDDSGGSRDSEFRMTPEIYRATEAVQFIYHHLKAEEEYTTVLDDWKYVARVLDRLLLYIFLTVTISGTIGVLMNAPHILEYVDQDKIMAGLLKYIAERKGG
ncbi:acetylcholine receptor subunit beta-like 1 isoform X2 [Babylonia areolata]|uniref:acetylcholine receptor subunit beta-like 1 isoform X2 n=1 Tax=Babylonia areolata TaxID=304850 RepID=UPI003FCFC9EA